jgi:hypothetical protein
VDLNNNEEATRFETEKSEEINWKSLALDAYLKLMKVLFFVDQRTRTEEEIFDIRIFKGLALDNLKLVVCKPAFWAKISRKSDQQKSSFATSFKQITIRAN